MGRVPVAGLLLQETDVAGLERLVRTVPELAEVLGLVPGRDRSGGRDPQTRTPKCGDDVASSAERIEP